MKNIVKMTKEQSRDLELITKVVRDLGGRRGCQACCSDTPLDFEIIGDVFARKSVDVEDNVYRYTIDEKGNLVEEKKA